MSTSTASTTTTLVPSTTPAIKVKAAGTAHLIPDAPIPALEPGYALIKVSHVALNPTDWKHRDYPTLARPGHNLGIDFAGTIVALGPGIARPLTVGQRVAGAAHGAASYDPDAGAFRQYVHAPARTLLRLPDGITAAGAATLPVALATAALALHQQLGLALPGSAAARAGPPVPLIVYGASSGMGLFAVQAARLGGAGPIAAACSARNFAAVRAAGATHVFDYKDAEACGAALRAATGDRAALVLDCIGEAGSGAICAAGMTSARGVGRYVSLLRGGEAAFPRSEEVALATSVLAYSMFGREYVMANGTAAVPVCDEDVEWIAMYVGLVERLLQSGDLVPVPFEERTGGLDGVLEGLDDVKAGRNSGRKIVYAL